MKAANQCKDCTDRHPGCHGECDSYKEYRKVIDKMHAEKTRRMEEDKPFMEKRLKRKACYIKRKQR